MNSKCETLDALIKQQATRFGDHIFLTATDRKGGIRHISYRDFYGMAGLVSVEIRTRYSLQGGDTIAFGPRNDLESILVIAAAILAQVRLLIYDPEEKEIRTTEKMVACNARCRALISDIFSDAAVSELPIAGEGDAEWMTGASGGSSSDPLFVIGTSGSTAASKLVVQSHGSALANAESVAAHHGLGAGKRLAGCLPLSHVNGLHFSFLATLYSGGHLILLPKFDPFTYVDSLIEFDATLASVVPSILDVLVSSEKFSKALPEKFGYFVSAASPLSRETARKVMDIFGVRVIQGYGLTETVNFATTIPADLSREDYQSLVLNVELPTIGAAISHVEVAVLDNANNFLKEGDIGEICVKGANLMSCYLGNDEATKQSMRDGWFHTGDSGFRIFNEHCGKDFFFLVGRNKNMAKVQGSSVSMEELERTICLHPDVEDCACFFTSGDEKGDHIHALLVGNAKISYGSLREHLLKRFKAQELPKTIRIVEAIPRTLTGKIKRAELAK